ncbi:MAG: fatty acid desaturase family protein [Myxococcota bacterium]
MRTGAELNRATRPFVEEDRARSWRLLLTTLALQAATLAAVVVVPPWWGKVALGVLAGLLNVRLFIFYHDYLHGAILRGSKAADAIMATLGFYMLAVRSVWRETHNYHHKHNSKLLGSAIGSFPIVTLGMWRGMSPAQRLKYRFARHPLTIFLGYLPVFLIGMTLSPFQRNPRKHWGGPVAVVAHLGLLALTWWLAGPVTALCLVVLPLAVSLGLGSYLFYAQHNFPDARLRCRREWDYTAAALEASSMFDMGPVMHWFTGNIGYHHVHHLNHRIPFYRLPEAMEALPELQSPGRTSWRPADVLACLRLDVWDSDRARMVSLSEIEAFEAPVEA